MSLREHQIVGAHWLAERSRALLGDAPRVGKCRTLLAGAVERGAERPMVICPAIVRTHWHREAEALGIRIPLVYSMDTLRAGKAPLLKKIMATRPDLLIIDEVHNFRHPTAQRTQVVLGRDGYARRFPTVWAASGTPVPKSPLDLWPLLASCFPAALTRLGTTTREAFEEEFVIKTRRLYNGQWRDKIVGVRNLPRFKALLDGIMLRRTLADLGTDVPPLDWQVLRLDTAHHEFIDPASGDRMLEAVTLERLEAIEKDPHVARIRRRIGELKAPAVISVVADELREEPERKLAVFAHHRDVLETLAAGLAEFGVAFVHGGTSGGDRDTEMRRFQRDPRVRVFIGQNIVCKEGIALDVADGAFLVEPDWTAVINHQLGNRILNTREGGRKAVQLVALAGTIDESITTLLRRETERLTELGLDG